MLKRNEYRQFRITGFSLIEMAVVLLIVSSLLGGLLLSIGTTREINNRNAAESTLEEIVEALYGYAQANGRLPCPATAASNGLASPAAAGACSGGAISAGFVPSATLGLSGPLNDDNLLVDEWLNPFRYVVTNASANAYTSTSMGGLSIAALANSADLRICDSAACTTVMADNLPAVVLSMGSDWATFTSGHEIENSGEVTTSGYRMPADISFVNTGYIEDIFDDQLNWVSPSILISRMISAGQLP